MSGRISIVVADDHDAFRDTLIHLLSLEEGIEVVGDAADGEGLCRLVRDLSPDVAVIDLNMPRMDGIEATREIRATAPVVGIIILSVSSPSGHMQQALEAGADRYLTKGVSRQELIASVRAVATRRAPLHGGSVSKSARVLAGDGWVDE